jgi:hypothetical protein
MCNKAPVILIILSVLYFSNLCFANKLGAVHVEFAERPKVAWGPNGNLMLVAEVTAGEHTPPLSTLQFEMQRNSESILDL